MPEVHLTSYSPRNRFVIGKPSIAGYGREVIMHQAFFEQLVAEHSRELMAEAEHRRLSALASPSRGVHPLIGKGLMGAGSRLFRWGARLADVTEPSPQITR
jgi:hypothetical protein